eukprot:Plantae.Rhodophyta-Purpureofilum_apyrenoidigerum.ctg6986.p1 GENE.Plantae.Rhodophyta-Purpureofilum_apyrenoidigerum.ctg6986~~Plantae.Rhodophyta-Purpureofilum_apyrenoidigerum.ctg6986.p1  ORF type:complete len:959 (-),score=182.09 Plantae.Rhodophyta-Purpureofilum_apyrenoidigerum.ctg6986:14-2800(-)
MAAYSTLLQEDRSLLVPIVGSASDLCLDETSREQLHDTLIYALGAIEEDDIPTVAYSVLRTEPSVLAVAELRKKTEFLSDSIACLVMNLIVDAIRLNRHRLKVLLSVSAECEGGITLFDLIVWAAALYRSRERAGVLVSMRQAAATGGFQADKIGAIVESHPQTLENHAENFLNLASILINVSDSFGCSASAIQAFVLNLFKHSSRVRRPLAAAIAMGICSMNVDVSRRAAAIVYTAAHLEEASVEAWVHVLLEPLQRAETINSAAVAPLTVAAGIFVASQKPLLSSLLISAQKQLLFGSAQDKKLGSRVLAELVPRLGPADSDEALQLLLRAAPMQKAEDDYTSEALLALARIAIAGKKVDVKRVRTIPDTLLGAVEVIDNNFVVVHTKKFLNSPDTSAHVAAAVAIVAAKMRSSSISFKIRLSDEAAKLVTGETSIDKALLGTLREIRYAADVIVQVVNICTEKGVCNGEEVLNRLREVQLLEILKRKSSYREEESVALSGLAASLALSAIETNDIHVSLVCRLLHCISILPSYDENVLTAAKLPRLSGILTSILNEETNTRVEKCRVMRDGDEETLQDAEDRLILCRTSIAYGLRIIALPPREAKLLSMEIIKSTSDAAIAASSVDMASRCGVDRQTAAELWVSSLFRVYEHSDRTLLPENPPAVYAAAQRKDSLGGYLDSRTNVASRLKSCPVLRYQIASLLSSLPVEDGIDTICALVRECTLPKSSVPQIGREAKNAVIAVLNQFVSGILRCDVPSPARAIKRVSLLHGLIELRRLVPTSVMLPSIPRAFQRIMGLKGSAQVLGAISNLSAHMRLITAECRSASASHQRFLPKLVFASDVLDDYIKDMAAALDLKVDLECLPPATRDSSASLTRIVKDFDKSNGEQHRTQKAFKKRKRGYEANPVGLFPDKTVDEEFIRVRFK